MLRLATQTASNHLVPQVTEAESQAAARAVVNLFARWGLTDAQAVTLLGGISPRSYARWKTGDVGRVDRDLATRLSILLGIHKALRLIFTDPHRGYGWVKRSSIMFDNHTPLDIMLGGDIFSLMRVRSYLDAERGPW